MLFGKSLKDMREELEWLDLEIGRWEDCLVRCKRGPKGVAARTVEEACKLGLGRMRRRRQQLAVKFDKAKDRAKPPVQTVRQDVSPKVPKPDLDLGPDDDGGIED